MTKFAAVGVCALPLFFAGCLASKKTQAAESPSTDKKIVGPTEYEYVYVTGSHIPVRVPKSSTARPLPNANPVSTMDAETFDRLIRSGQRPGTVARFR